ncbi:hypothetical protein BXA17_20040, partial [Acinetobacter baumannii]
HMVLSTDFRALRARRDARPDDLASQSGVSTAALTRCPGLRHLHSHRLRDRGQDEPPRDELHNSGSTDQTDSRTSAAEPEQDADATAEEPTQPDDVLAG